MEVDGESDTIQEAACREERGTDKSISKCRMRYQVFRTHYPALSQLQAVMPFSVIDATGSLEDCEAQIAHELRYGCMALCECRHAIVAVSNQQFRLRHLDQVALG